MDMIPAEERSIFSDSGDVNPWTITPDTSLILTDQIAQDPELSKGGSRQGAILAEQFQQGINKPLRPSFHPTNT